MLPVMQQAPPTTVVILGLSATGLALARALGPAHCKGIGIDADRWQPAHWTRHLAHPRHLAARALDLSLANDLVALAATQPGPCVVLAASDPACNFLADHRAVLSPSLALSEAYVSARVQPLLDKSAFARACAVAGLDTPQTVDVHGPGDVVAFGNQVGWPILLKPRASFAWRQRLGGAKLVAVAGPGQVAAALGRFSNDFSAIVAQAEVPGRESDLLVAAVVCGERDGVVHDVLTARKLRQWPVGYGSASAVRIDRLPDVEAAARATVQALGLRGLHGLEWKRDARSGALRLLEVNPRACLWLDVARLAGAVPVAIHLADLTGQALPLAPAALAGTLWRYGLRDTVALVAASARSVTGLRALASELTGSRAAGDAVFEWADPAPLLAAVLHGIRSPGQRGTGEPAP
ncbi:MAG: hypothetical protein EXR79_09990 [Myxococcales bacterium]|nr:hypothetical protein [Myxococcales bacterium]